MAQDSWAQAILLPQPPELLELQACATMPSGYSISILLVPFFFFKMGFHHDGQAGLELLT